MAGDDVVEGDDVHGRLPELIQDPADYPLTAELAITDFLPVGCHLNVPLRLADGAKQPPALRRADPTCW